MRIYRYEFESTQKGWSLSPVEFSDLTLLVGLSGVGKTRILRSLATVVRAAEGKTTPGSRWSISFTDENFRKCVWSGESERLPDWGDSEQLEFFSGEDPDDNRKKSRILSERLLIDEKIAIDRTVEQISFFGQRVPKLSPYESAISLFKEEDEIKPISKSFQRVIFSDRTEHDGFSRRFVAYNPDRLMKSMPDIEAVKQSSHAALTKLFLAFHIKDKSFSEVRDRFLGVFPSVEDLSFRSIKDDDADFGNMVFAEIKEKGIDQPIPQKDISSGMMRTLSHLAELYLSPPGTVILIDEFENSLGVNCIDAVTEDLIDASSSIQFLITSHHPYIINNVSSDHWKVVFRVGSEVRAINAEEIGIGISAHDAFLQLLNSDRYANGIIVPESDV